MKNQKTEVDVMGDVQQNKAASSLASAHINYRIDDLMGLFGIGRSTVYELVKKGILPPPIKLGRSSIWLGAEVYEAIKKRIAERDGEVS